MRKVAGIMLIIFGLAAITLFIVNVSRLTIYLYEWGPPHYVSIITAILAMFFIIGGVFCIKGKYWKVCFASSFFLHILATASILFYLGLLFSVVIFLWISLIPVWILPLIFICLRRSEWSEAEA